MPNKFYSLPKSVFENYHAKIKDWVRAVLPTKTSDLTNDSDFLDQLALAGIIAVTFSASSTYKVGDYVLYNHTLYRCKTAITTAGAWDASKWDAAKTQDIFSGSAPGLVPTPTAQDVANKNMLAADGTYVPHQDLSEYIKEVNLDDIVAEVFSTSKTYAVGDYVIHEKKLHRCTTAVQTAGDWSSSNWTQVKSTDIFQGSAPGLVPAAESGDADKVLKGDGTWGEAGSSVRINYDSVTEELHMDFSPIPTEVTIGEHTYPVVQIGNQLWTAENLIYLPNGIAFTSNSSFTDAPEAAYYNNQSSYNSCGLIYNGNCVSILNTAVPTGWHIPYKTDYINLIDTYGINNLYASTLWNPPGVNGTNLSIYPYGFRGKGSDANAFDGYGYRARYLTSDNVGGTNAYGIINLEINGYDVANVWYPWGGYIRLVKNLT